MFTICLLLLALVCLCVSLSTWFEFLHWVSSRPSLISRFFGEKIFESVLQNPSPKLNFWGKSFCFFLHNSTSSPFLYFVLLFNLVCMIESSCYALSFAVPKMGEESLYRCDKTYKIIALGIFKNTYFRFSNTFIYNDPRFPYSFLFSESRG